MKKINLKIRARSWRELFERISDEMKKPDVTNETHGRFTWIGEEIFHKARGEK